MRDDFTPITDEYKLLEPKGEPDTAEDDDVDIFRELFKFSLSEMARVYKMHKEQKRDSWKKAPVEYLRIRLEEEMKEWSDSVDDSSAEYNEIIDILNVGFMLLERLADTHGLQIEED